MKTIALLTILTSSIFAALANTSNVAQRSPSGWRITSRVGQNVTTSSTYSNVHFDNVPIGSSEDKTVTTGAYCEFPSCASVTIETQMGSSPGFALVSDGCNGMIVPPLNQGQSVTCSFTIRFSPTASGSYSGYLQYKLGATTVDYLLSGNGPVATPTPVPSPPPKPTSDKKSDPPTMCSAKKPGSVIGVDNQVLQETVSVVGAPFSLHYSSERVVGRKTNYKASIPCHGSASNGFSRQLTVSAGASQLGSFTCTPSQLNSAYDFTWTGYLPGYTTFHYKPITYQVSISDSQTGLPTTTSSFQSTIGGLDARLYRVGGWTPSFMHFYDAESKRVYYGEGDSEYADLELRTDIPSALGETTGYVKVRGDEVLVFNLFGVIKTISDRLTGQVLFTITTDSTYRPEVVTDAANKHTQFRYYPGRIEIISPYGQYTELLLDGYGFLTSVKSPSTTQHSFTYWGTEGLLKSFTTPAGRTSNFTYDTEGRLLTDVGAGGISTSLSKTSTPTGWQIIATSAMGKNETHSLTSTGAGSSTRTSVVDGETSVGNFSNAGNSFTSAEGLLSTSATSQGRFGAGELYTSSSAESVVGASFARSSVTNRTSLPAASNPFSVTDINEQLVLQNNSARSFTSNYNRTSRKLISTSPMGKTTEITYGSAGAKIVSIKEGPFLPYEISYDSQGRISSEGFAGRTTTYIYDQYGRVTNRNSAQGSTEYAYDTNGRVLSVQNDYGNTIGFAYNDDGYLLSVKPFDKPHHYFTPNMSDLTAAYLPPSIDGISMNTYYNYNNDGQLTSTERPVGTVTNTYDGLKVATSSGATFARAFTWDKSFLSSGVTSPDNNFVGQIHTGPLLTKENQNVVATGLFGAVRFTYDSEMRLSNVGLQKNGSDLGALTGYTYNLDGQYATIGNSTVTYSATSTRPTSVTQGSSELILGWDDTSAATLRFGELKSRSFKINGVTRFSQTLSRDSEGRVSSSTIYRASTGQTRTENYSYSSRGQLESADSNGSNVRFYSYDGNGNRLTKNYDYYSKTDYGWYDNQDRIVSYGTGDTGPDNFNYGYNANGELTTRMQYNYDTSVDSTTSFTWDEFGQLRTATLPNNDVITYVYDVRGRRVGKMRNGVSERTWIYLDQTRILAEFDGAGNLLARYVYGLNGQTPDYMINSAGTHRIVTDHIGSVRGVYLTDGALTTTQETDYDEFGRVIWKSNNNFVTSLGFAGGVFDSDTGLVHFGARDYDPIVGRWISKDPILFGGDDSNLYSYVFQDPINLIDSEPPRKN